MSRTGAALALGAALAAASLAACGGGPIGHGLVLWADGSAPAATGSVIAVVQESEIEDEYRFRADPESDDLVGLARWRVRLVEDAETAQELATAYEHWIDSYGYAARRGLPIRAEQSATASIVYRLREGQLVKVIGRSLQPVEVGVFQNYWYRVLTEDGTEGYCFGEFLPVFTTTGDPLADVARLRAEDPALQRVLGTTWRPEYYREMIQAGRLDLSRFRPDYGLFPDAATRTFELTLEGTERRFQYQALERVADGIYVLQGTDARITVHRPDRISVSYSSNGRLVTRVFVDLGASVAEMIEAERARRDLLYADLLRRAEQLQSSAYGTIELAEDRRFRWRGYGALVPRLLPRGLAGSGEVDFKYALAEQLGASYDAALTLTFDNAGGGVGAELTLLVAYAPQGMRLTPVEPDRESLQVTAVGRSALVMFFEFAGA